MIDPDNLLITKHNLSSSTEITHLPTIDYNVESVYDLNDEKDYDHYIKDCERIIRRSFEYKQFINYLRDNMNMNKCAFLSHVSNTENYGVKIEIHHYPFTLRDIVEIVYRKRCHYEESLSVFMVAKEVMELHYKLMVGLIPLSETIHELAHNGKIFIPVDRVLGRYNLFVDYYSPFISAEMLDTLRRIENYTYSNDANIGDTTIINTNHITYDIKDKQYLLPNTKCITDDMFTQIKAIKDNNYLLPIAPKLIETTNKQSEKRCPFIFIKEEKRSPFVFSN